MRAILRSPFGRSLRGVQDSPVRMEALGYNVWLHKYIAFVLAAGFAGFAGTLFVGYKGFVSPESASIIVSAEVMLMVILGGAGTLTGPVLGAFVIILLSNLISAYTARWTLILGAMYAIVVLVAPAGIVGELQAASKAKRGAAMNALSVRHATINFGGVRAVTDITIELAVGERRVLLGPNGAGKTTLFNIIGGQIRPKQGSVSLFGRNVTHLPPFQRAHAGLARTFQITTLFPSLSVADNIYLAVQAGSAARYAMLRDADNVRDTVGRVETILAEWHFAAERSAAVRDLSYGEQRKLELAMALAGRPRLLLLDEPTAGLSTSETQNVVALVCGLGRDVTVLVIEHDMDVAFAIGERFTIMNQGSIVADGTAEDIRANAQVQSIYFGDAEA